MKNVSFYTLGCKLNFAETSTLARMLSEKGFRKVDFSEPADLCIINTCSVTDNADKECRQIVRRALRISPGAVIAVTGCYAQLKPQEIASIQGVDLVLGANEKFRLSEYLEKLSKRSFAEVHACEIGQSALFSSSYSLGDRTRSFLKVQDGCDYTCSYCTIPLARGKSRSDSIANVIRNAEKLAKEGIKEIVLTGVNTGDFGKTRPDDERYSESFFGLLKALDEVEGIERIRISSVEPNLLKDEIISFVSASRKFVPHFHIPLQSGSDKILKLMRRRYLSDLYRDRIGFIKKAMPHCAIGADVIVGFPGETEKEFMETFDFIHSLEISYLHVFTYSERDHTDALLLPGKVPLAERQRRNKILRNLSLKKQRRFYEQNAGTERKALFESENKNGFMFGYTDNYLKVKTAWNPALVNKTRTVFLTAADEDCIMSLADPSLA